MVQVDTILKTKLFIPRLPHMMISRDRLLQKMNQFCTTRLLIVSAPSGFGKTTLLSDWIQQLGHPAAWVSLDKEEDDLARFWAYVISAFQKNHQSLGNQVLALLQSTIQPSSQDIVTLLINELLAIETDVVLVLDDFHVIKNESIHESLSYLVERIPEHVHICISSREKVPLAIGNLRMKGFICEIESAEMKFTKDEIAAYWEKQQGEALSENDLTVLEDRTEGWIAALQLAVMLCKNESSLSPVLSKFSGKNRYVTEYLLEEVFSHLPRNVQVFLMMTSLLERFNRELCSQFCEVVTLEETFQVNQQASLLLVPLDEEGYWYRYHRLFADFLRAQLQRQLPEQIAVVHRKASEWFVSHQLIGEAIDHSLAAGDQERVGHLIGVYGKEFLKSGETTRLAGWLRQLPTSVTDDPVLLIISCWVNMLIGNSDAALLAMNRLQAVIQEKSNHLSDELRDRFSEEAAVIKMFSPVFQGNYLLAYQMLAELHDRDDWKEVHRNYKGRLVLDFGIELNRGYASVTVFGKVKQAESYHSLFAAFVEKNPFMKEFHFIANHYSVLGGIRYEQNELEQAMHFVDRAIDVCLQKVNWGAYIPAVLTKARILWTKGQYEESMDVVNEAISMTKRSDNNQQHWLHILEAFSVRYYLLHSNMEAVNEWVKTNHLSIERQISKYQEYENITYIRVLIAQLKYTEALQFSQSLEKAVQRENRLGSLLETYLLQAVMLYRLGEAEKAIKTLHKALVIADEDGYFRTLLDDGDMLSDVFEHYLGVRKNRYLGDLNTGVLLLFVEKIYSCILEEDTTSRNKMTDPAKKLALLTNREREVVSLLAVGYTNKQIAEELCISSGTVKIHLNRVFEKMDATNRIQAIQKAKLLGIIH
ncbi:LuxR C-terminal-related transcriptional regulator [Brevibacillus sp. SYSU BS000544]|uniref:LuxR C-terminal-related transcriptional regulator n=1 Tax=Brevibacillus sp. SYSU BS000544 TaxID=3416443 RepID=UPI003CE543B7